jgi:uncharacterized protein (DUF1501 family)
MTTYNNDHQSPYQPTFQPASRGADQFDADQEIAPGITRRSFMAALGLGATAAAVPLAGASAASSRKSSSRKSSSRKPPVRKSPAPSSTPTAPTAPTSPPTPAASGDGILVMVTLYGGNDGLNMVVPYSDPAYLAARQAVAVNPDQVLKLDANFGLHPSFVGLKNLFDQKHLALVHGVGYPDANRSHFRSMDIWQTAQPSEISNTGWLGKWHDATGPDALRMVNIGGSLPRYMVGTKGSGANLNPGKITIAGGPAGEKVLGNLARNAENTGALGALGARIAASNADLLRVKNTYAPLLNASTDVVATGGTNLEGDGINSLTRDLQEIAKLINAGAPARVYGASIGGFDTHASELEQHARLLSFVDQALTQFHSAMTASPRGQKVTVVVYSEFGRRLQINGSDGTDHGAASAVMVLGPQVKGGQYGQPPSLTDLNDGDLKFTTDFRSVYSTVLGQTLGIDPSVSVGKAFPALGFL